MDNRLINSTADAVQRLQERAVRMRMGVITDDAPLSVAVGGSTVPYTNVRAIGAVAVNQKVVCLMGGNDIVVLGNLSGTGGGGGGGEETDPIATAALAAHASDVTDVHGIADTSLLVDTGDLAAYALLASPTFTGDPKAPTASPGDNDTTIATTAFVTAAIAAGGGSYQPLDSDLTAIAALTTTSFGRSLLEAANATAARTLTGAVGLTGNETITGLKTFQRGTDNLPLRIARFTDSSPTADLLQLTQSDGATKLAYFDASGNLHVPSGDLDTQLAAKQPLDSDLTAIAALTTTSFGRSLLALADAAALRSTAGLVIGTNVQAWDADLDAIAALTTTSIGRSLLAGADSAALRAITVAAGLDVINVFTKQQRFDPDTDTSALRISRNTDGGSAAYIRGVAADDSTLIWQITNAGVGRFVGVDAGSQKITSVATPTATDDAATRVYADQQGSLGGLKQRWAPGAGITAIDESIGREFLSPGFALTSGTLLCIGNLVLPAGATCTSLMTLFGTTGTSLTHTWMALISGVSTRTVVGLTADDTSATVTASGHYTKALTTPYTNPSAVNDLLVYVGVCSVGATPPQIRSFAGSSTVMGITPIQIGTSNTGLTTPASLGATANALTATANMCFAALV